MDLAGSLSVSERNLSADLIEIKKIVSIPLTDSTLLNYAFLSEMNGNNVILSSDSRVLIIDMAENKVLLSLNRKGNGPQEYIEIGNVSADWDQQELFVFDIQKQHVNVYSFQGDYLRTIPAPNNECSGVNNSGNNLIWEMMGHQKSLPWLYYTDKKGHLVDSSRIRTPKTNLLMFFSPSVIKNGEDVFIQTFNSDTLYSLSKGQIIPAIVLSRGRKNMPLSYYSNYELYSRYYFNYIIWGPYVVTEDLIFLEYDYHKVHYQDIWNQVNGRLIARRILQNPEDSKGFPISYDGQTLYFWPSRANGNSLVGLESASDSIELVVAELRK